MHICETVQAILADTEFGPLNAKRYGVVSIRARDDVYQFTQILDLF